MRNAWVIGKGCLKKQNNPFAFRFCVAVAVTEIALYHNGLFGLSLENGAYL
jgi:hypothetical protein